MKNALFLAEGKFMSTLYYESLPKQAAFATDISFSAFSFPLFTQENCIGQDAGYIVRKRALILDLWNLQEEKSVCNDKNDKKDFFDLPVIFDNSKDLCFVPSEIAVPVQ